MDDSDVLGATAASPRRRCPEVSQADPLVVDQIGGAILKADDAIANHIGIFRKKQGHADVLLNNKYGQTVPGDAADRAENVEDCERRKRSAGLVEQQHFRLRHQSAAGNQHLPLAARQHRRTLFSTRGKVGEITVDALEIAVRTRLIVIDEAADLQILLDGHSGIDLLPLGHLDKTAANDFVRPHALDFLAVELDRSAARLNEAGDRLEERGLSGAIAAKHGDDLASADAETDAAQDLDRAVAGLEVRDLEHCAARPLVCQVCE